MAPKREKKLRRVEPDMAKRLLTSVAMSWARRNIAPRSAKVRACHKAADAARELLDLDASRVVWVASHRPMARSTSSGGTNVKVKQTIPKDLDDAGRRQITAYATHEFLLAHALLCFRDLVMGEHWLAAKLLDPSPLVYNNKPATQFGTLRERLHPLRSYGQHCSWDKCGYEELSSYFQPQRNLLGAAWAFDEEGFTAEKGAAPRVYLALAASMTARQRCVGPCVRSMRTRISSPTCGWACNPSSVTETCLSGWPSTSLTRILWVASSRTSSTAFRNAVMPSHVHLRCDDEKGKPLSAECTCRALRSVRQVSDATMTMLRFHGFSKTMWVTVSVSARSQLWDCPRFF